MVVRALAAATVSAVVTTFVMFAFNDQSVLSSGGILMVFTYGIPMAGTLALIVGLPAHLLLSRFRIRSLAAYLAAGVVAALVFGVAMERAPVTPHPMLWSEVGRMTSFALPGAAVAATVFWWLAVRRKSGR